MRFVTSPHRGLLSMLATVALLAGCQSQPKQTSPPPQSEDINWLFVMSATSGSFDGKTITLRDVPPALMFSDRPYRIWGHMQTAELLRTGEEGSDSFAEDPPNAVLSTFRTGEEPTEATVVLHRPSLAGTDLSFPVDVLEGDIPATFGPASLFIDHWHPHPHIGAFVVGAAIGHAASQPKTQTVVVREPTYYYHADPVPVAVPVTAPVAASAEDRLAEAKHLFDKGLISKDEYEKKREDILATM